MADTLTSSMLSGTVTVYEKVLALKAGYRECGAVPGGVSLDVITILDNSTGRWSMS
jgi:hypothetical protein